jgi:DNA-binding NtrC family response regulator
VSRIRILLVEDELALLHLLEKHLNRLGFEVDAYPKALDALAAFTGSPANYDLVIADLGIPDMPGDTLLTKMLAIKPDLLYLICSGSPFFIASLPAALQHKVSFLQKPFLPKMLAEAIENLLARRGIDKP